jgi:transcriptional regulator with XRE-family HTH domain
MAKKKYTPEQISDIPPVEQIDPTAEFSIAQKKDYAKMLFVREHLSQKEISQRVGVSEQTMSKWANSENWDKLKKSLLITKQEELGNLYEQLTELNALIKNRPEGQRFANHKEALILDKLTAAIRQMETETSIADVVDVSMKFGDYVRIAAPEKVKDVTELQDSFIKSML